jgi:WD40 repeat protein
VKGYKYKAFISYSHAADDTIAPPLQRALQQFARPWRKMRALRIFRDQTHLALNPHLWSTIEQALDDSEYFILLASPEAAQSPWVQRELAHWLSHRPPDTLLIVLTKGEIAWDNATGEFDWATTTAVPRTFSKVFAGEPLYSDFRQARTHADLSLRNPDFLNRIARIASTLHGRSLDEMIGEDVEQHRRFKLFSRSVITGLVILLVAVAAASWVAWRQRMVGVSRELAASALAQVTARPDLGALLALEGVATGPTVQAEQALRDASIKADVRGELLRIQREAQLGATATRFANELPSRNGSLVLRSDADGLYVEDTKTKTRLSRFPRHKDTVTSAAFSPDDTLIVSVDEGGEGFVWNTRTGESVFSFRSAAPGDWFIGVVWSPDGRFFVTGGVDRSARIRQVGTWRQIASFDNQLGAVDLIAVSPDGSVIATGSTSEQYGVPVDRTVNVWEAKSGKAISALSDERRAVQDVGFSSDGTLVVTEYDDGTTRIWDWATGESVASWSVGEFSLQPGTDAAIQKITAGTRNISGEGLYGITDVAFTPDGKFLIAVEEDGGATVWQMPTAVRRAVLPTFTDSVRQAFTFSASGRQVIANDDKTTRIWDIATWTELPAAPPRMESEIAAFLRSVGTHASEVVSPDGHVAVALATANNPNAGLVIDKAHGRSLGILAGAKGSLVAAAFSPDGRRIAVADGSPDVLIHRWETIAPLDDLITLTRKRTGRALTPEERLQFVPPTLGQLLRGLIGGGAPHPAE